MGEAGKIFCGTFGRQRLVVHVRSKQQQPVAKKKPSPKCQGEWECIKFVKSLYLKEVQICRSIHVMTLNMERLCFRSWWMALDGRLACSISWERLRGLVWSAGLLPAWCRVRGSYNCRNTWPIYSLAFLQTSRHSGGLQCAARPCLTAPLSGTHWDSLNRWVHLCFDF